MSFHGTQAGWESGCKCRHCWAWASRAFGMPMPTEAQMLYATARGSERSRERINRMQADEAAARRLKHLEECARPRKVRIHGVGMRDI